MNSHKSSRIESLLVVLLYQCPIILSFSFSTRPCPNVCPCQALFPFCTRTDRLSSRPILTSFPYTLPLLLTTTSSENHPKKDENASTSSSSRRLSTASPKTTLELGTAPKRRTQLSARKAQTQMGKYGILKLEEPKRIQKKSQNVARSETPVNRGEKKTSRSSPEDILVGSGLTTQMLRHDILSREEEIRLGQAIVKAKRMRERVTQLLQERDFDEDDKKDDNNNSKKKKAEEDNEITRTDEDGIPSATKLVTDPTHWLEEEIDDDLEEDEMKENDYTIPTLDQGPLSIRSSKDRSNDENTQVSFIYGSSDDRYRTSSNREQQQQQGSTSDLRGPSALYTSTITCVQDAKKLNIAAIQADVDNLSDEEIRDKLLIRGGRKELLRILYAGSKARVELMRNNIRLVVSICKKWMRKGMGSTNSRNIDGSNIMASMYSGGPSLDEIVQEGVLGLARAVDKYDPSRGLRFSTYSSHWITNYVRQYFQASLTSLKIPQQVYEYKNAYKEIVKKSLESMEPLPSDEDIAAQLGITVGRLRTAIRATESLLSIDQPVYLGGSPTSKGSGAGGDASGEDGLLISDTLHCSETPPEDFVDYCFLRQCLENAMATELSPYERDVIRLRLGLDDGQSRTVREVADITGGALSIADIRSVERRAFKKLRSPNALHAHNLMAFLDIVGVNIEVTSNWYYV